MDYRPIPEDHDEAVHRLLSYAFQPERGPDPDDEDHERPEEYHRRGLYDVDPDTPTDDPDTPTADDLVVTCGYYDFTARIRDEFHPVGGVSAVASPPESRRRGYVADLLANLHREFREEEIGFAVLWPFEYAFYRRFGYAMTNTSVTTSVPPAELGDVVPDPAGTFRRLDAGDYAELDTVHRAWATEALGLRRTEGWWRYRTFQGWRKDPYVYGWADRTGTLRGYLCYTVDEDGDDKRMDVSELAAVDDEARGHLLRFCRDHDSQVDTVRLRGKAGETRLLQTLSDPRAVDVEVRPGPMARIVDLETVVDALSFPDDATGSVALAVRDDHCDWNDGTFELTVGSDGATCLRSDADADATLDIGALSQLALGSLSVDELERNGDLTVESAAARETLAALFPTEAVYLREGF
ncbi:Predicted acetyltransferase [Halogranum amylolyticum]|uniref:Predicted acetyltransferase n=1 Tax=Halogranum amylolyticum TaxID=660520 RepID=A0A1H8NL92_9EURY|nr:GNAT family N-acetyltransferase [Halogranum amylolyticum]SEO30279.1 Predicted acetyltransferase [Halogranum amylolyticum]